MKQSIVARWLRVSVQRTGGNVADVDVIVAVTTAVSSSVGKDFPCFCISFCLQCFDTDGWVPGRASGL